MTIMNNVNYIDKIKYFIVYTFYLFSKRTVSGKINNSGTAVPLLSSVFIFYSLPFFLLIVSKILEAQKYTIYLVTIYFIAFYIISKKMYLENLEISIKYYTNNKPNIVLFIISVILYFFSVVFFFICLYLFRYYGIM